MAVLEVKSDREIQEDVLAELRWDSRIRQADVGVEVDDGVVTLTGTVDSWAKKLAAREAAYRVAGVRDVADDVRVKLSGSLERTDTEIAQDVRYGLEWNPFVPEKDIRSTVSDGRVTLEGQVHTLRQKQDAGRAVRHLGSKGNRQQVDGRAPKGRPGTAPEVDRAGARTPSGERSREDRRLDSGRHRDPEGSGPDMGREEGHRRREPCAGHPRGSAISCSSDPGTSISLDEGRRFVHPERRLIAFLAPVVGFAALPPIPNEPIASVRASPCVTVDVEKEPERDAIAERDRSQSRVADFRPPGHGPQKTTTATDCVKSIDTRMPGGLSRGAAREPLILLALLAGALAVSGIAPKDRLTWILEEMPIFLGVPVLIVTFRRVRLTRLTYRLIFFTPSFLRSAATTLSRRSRPDSGCETLSGSLATTSTASSI